MEPENTTVDTDNRRLRKLRADMRAMAKNIGREEARALVETYYMLQDDRIRINNRLKAVLRGATSNEPPQVLDDFLNELLTLEKAVGSALKAFADNAGDVGAWLMQTKGVGPVMTAGLISRLDVTKAKAAACFWRHAGLDPTMVWEKGMKRPFDADLKKLCYLISKSFVLTSGHEDAYYGHVYHRRKEYEQNKNEAGDYESIAREYYLAFPWNKGKTYSPVLESGKLPQFLIDRRCRRYAVKMFLSHLYVVMYEHLYQEKAPDPWIIVHGGHVGLIPPPNWPLTKA